MERVTNVHELLEALGQLQDLYVACGAKTAEKTVAKTIELLRPHDGKPLDMFMAETRAAAATAEAKSASPPAPIDEAVVDRYARRLADAGTDKALFEDTFATLNADAGVKLKEADAIARQFTHQQSPYKTKKAALIAIRQTFVERVRFENKLKAVS